VRILVVTHYFPPEIGAPQARLSELAHHWAQAGDEVTVVTGIGHLSLGCGSLEGTYAASGMTPPSWKNSWPVGSDVTARAR
jgi:hypothetical protein